MSLYNIIFYKPIIAYWVHFILKYSFDITTYSILEDETIQMIKEENDKLNEQEAKEIMSLLKIILWSVKDRWSKSVSSEDSLAFFDNLIDVLNRLGILLLSYDDRAYTMTWRECLDRTNNTQSKWNQKDSNLCNQLYLRQKAR